MNNNDEALRSEWVAALRSGEYDQKPQALATLEYDKVVGYCCLGVLCVVAGIDAKKITNHCYIKECWGGSLGLSGEAQEMLSRLNDDLGWTFDQIADLIEGKHEAIKEAASIETASRTWTRKLVPIDVDAGELEKFGAALGTCDEQ